jgi:hypothetical protein
MTELSRQKDLTHVEDKIRSLGMEAQKVQAAFQKYSTEVHQAIRDLLEKAGVWEEVNSMEVTRAGVAKKAEDKIKVLNAEAQDLQKVRAFLLGRAQEEAVLDEVDEGDESDDAEDAAEAADDAEDAAEAAEADEADEDARTVPEAPSF